MLIDRPWAESTLPVDPTNALQISANFIGSENEEDNADLVQRAYRGRYQRLAALKRTYEPTNLSRLNTNVQPA